MAVKPLTRKIYISGEISTESYLAFSKRLSRLERDSRIKDIEIEIVSEGGSAYDALAFCGRMRSSPCTLKVTAHGLVASAAVLILAAGDKRLMSAEAWVMVHEDAIAGAEGSVTEMEKLSSHLRRMEDQWASLLSGLTTCDSEEWGVMHKETTYLTAEECLELGLIDAII